jgi:hypothetical protein
MKRNEFGAPVGFMLQPDEATVLQQAQLKKKAGNFSKKHAAEIKAFFQSRYPDPEGLEEDLLGEAGKKELSLEEMEQALKAAGVKISPNAKPATIKKKYEELA